MRYGVRRAARASVGVILYRERQAWRGQPRRVEPPAVSRPENQERLRALKIRQPSTEGGIPWPAESQRIPV